MGNFVIRKIFQYLNKKQVPKDPIKFHLKYIQDVFALGELKNYLDNQKEQKNQNWRNWC